MPSIRLLSYEQYCRRNNLAYDRAESRWRVRYNAYLARRRNLLRMRDRRAAARARLYGNLQRLPSGVYGNVSSFL